MRRLLRHRSLILALALLLGQWLAFAHALQHPALLDDPACALCVHAQSLGSGALAAAPTAPSLPVANERPRAPRARVLAFVSRSIHPIRGPPSTARSSV